MLEHGASGFMLFSPSGGTPDAVSLGRWAGDVVPAVREAITDGKRAGARIEPAVTVSAE